MPASTVGLVGASGFLGAVDSHLLRSYGNRDKANGRESADMEVVAAGVHLPWFGGSESFASEPATRRSQ